MQPFVTLAAFDLGSASRPADTHAGRPKTKSINQKPTGIPPKRYQDRLDRPGNPLLYQVGRLKVCYSVSAWPDLKYTSTCSPTTRGPGSGKSTTTSSTSTSLNLRGSPRIDPALDRRCGRWMKPCRRIHGRETQRREPRHAARPASFRDIARPPRPARATPTHRP